MKRNTLIALLLILVSSAQSQITDPGGEAASSQPEFSDMELLETWGWLLAERFALKGLEITEYELELITKGMAAHVAGDRPATELQHSANQMQEYFDQREARVLVKQIREGHAAEEAFFDTLWGKPGIQSLGTGLHFEISEEGEGRKPTPNDMVEVHYRGRFINGDEFDSSYRKGQPARFKLNGVIPGWTQGVQQIAKGGKIKLYVPSKLGYGDAGTNGVPAASTLIFDIELLNIISDVAPPGAPELKVEP